MALKMSRKIRQIQSLMTACLTLNNGVTEQRSPDICIIMPILSKSNMFPIGIEVLLLLPIRSLGGTGQECLHYQCLVQCLPCYWLYFVSNFSVGNGQLSISFADSSKAQQQLVVEQMIDQKLQTFASEQQ